MNELENTLQDETTSFFIEEELMAELEVAASLGCLSSFASIGVTPSTASTMSSMG